MRRNTRILLVGSVLAALTAGGAAVRVISTSTPEFKGGGGFSPNPVLLSLSKTLYKVGSPWLSDLAFQLSIPNAFETSSLFRTPTYQLEFDTSLVSDGQFVWGPNVGRFDIGSFLADQGSPLARFAPDIELWASYSSVNPKLLIAILELQQGWVSAISDTLTEDEIRTTIEDTAMGLATTFYEHLYTWGARRPAFRMETVMSL